MQEILLVLVLLQPTAFSVVASFVVSALLVPTFVVAWVAYAIGFHWDRIIINHQDYSLLVSGLAWVFCSFATGLGIFFGLRLSYTAEWSPRFQSVAKKLGHWRQPISI